MEILSFTLAFLAFVALALAMDRHHGQILQGRPSLNLRTGLRLSATALLLISVVPCVAAFGWSIGLTWWLGFLAAAATALLLLLTYRPKIIPAMAVALPALAFGHFVIMV